MTRHCFSELSATQQSVRSRAPAARDAFAASPIVQTLDPAGWFFIDVLAIIPFAEMMPSTPTMAAGSDRPQTANELNEIARMLRLGRLSKLIKLTKLVRIIKIVKDKSMIQSLLVLD